MDNEFQAIESGNSEKSFMQAQNGQGTDHLEESKEPEHRSSMANETAEFI